MTCPDGRSGGRRFCVRCGLMCKIGVRLSSSSRTEYGRFNLTLPRTDGLEPSPCRFGDGGSSLLKLRRENWRGAGVEPASQESPPVSSLDEPRCEATPGSNRGRPRMPRAWMQASDDGPSLPCRWPLSYYSPPPLPPLPLLHPAGYDPRLLSEPHIPAPYEVVKAWHSALLAVYLEFVPMY